MEEDQKMIRDETKIIYSKRFPKVDLNEFCKGQGGTDDDIFEPPVPFETFRKRLAENSTYIVNPTKLKWRQEFIDMAVRLSSEYEIDMDIEDHLYYISVCMYLGSASCVGRLKALFTLLLSMCDRITCLTTKNGTSDFTITLDYHTHDHYLSGRKVDF